MSTFAGTVLTEESILAARQWFAGNAKACIKEARSGRIKVNDLDRYVRWNEQAAEASLAGASDHTFAFLQRAHFIQTGECVALLP